MEPVERVDPARGHEQMQQPGGHHDEAEPDNDPAEEQRQRRHEHQ